MGVPQNLILYGQEGIGKTSLLLKFQKELKGLDDVYFLQIPLTDGNFDDIYSLIIEKCVDDLNIDIADKIASSGINIPLEGVLMSSETPKTSPAVAFEKILNIIYDGLDFDQVLIVLLDDLQRIMGCDETMRVLTILQTALLELSLKGKNIMFTATLSEDIFNRIEDKMDSAVRIFEPFPIAPLSYSEVYDAISIPAKEQNVVFKEDVIEKIYELSSGIPYYM